MKDDQPIVRCDHSRVDRFLDTEAPDSSDEEFLRHLDYCVECRAYLEEEAAEVGVWEKLRQHLVPLDYDIAGDPDYSAASAVISGKSNGAEAVIDALAPTDNPHNLGRLGGHEITGVVGVGGMGVVLKAVDPALDRVVAIKVMAPHLANNGTARRRFSREAKAAAAVLHPNVIPIHCVSSDEAIPHLVMAYIRGGSLQKRLDREGPLPTVEILRIGSQVAAGLAAAHEQGLVHRDIKPENILLEEGVERVTLTDFGLARAVDDISVTREGTIAGTPQYMSPEQARGEAVDQQSDLFSLGSVLYALCTGRAPFRAESTYGVMRRISDNDPTPIRALNPEIPEWLSEIIERLMAKQKPDRFGSAQEVQKLLEACLNHVQQPTVVELPEQLKATAPEKESLHDRFRLSGLMSGLAFMALLLAGIVYYIQTNNGTVRVEVTDESLLVNIEGQTVTMQEGNKLPIKLHPGPHKLVVVHGDTKLITDNFEIERNDKIVFKVDLLPGRVIVSREGREHWSAALPVDRQNDLSSGTAQNPLAGSIGRSTKLSAIAITNGCEVSGRFTAEEAEVSVHNPTKEPREVIFHYKIIYRNSRNFEDTKMLTQGDFKATVPPSGRTVNRFDGLLDLIAGMPTKDLKDVVVIRVHEKPFSLIWDRPIRPDEKLDLALLPVTIASWPASSTNLSKAKRIARVQQGCEGITAIARTGSHVRVSGAFTKDQACLWFDNPQGADREERLNYQVVLRDSTSPNDIRLVREGELQLKSKSGSRYVRRIDLPAQWASGAGTHKKETIEIRVSHQPIDLEYVEITPEKEPYVLRKTVAIASCPTHLLALPAQQSATNVPGGNSQSDRLNHSPVIELKWAASEHIPGFTHHENRGDYTGDAYYSLKPVLTLSPEFVASVKYVSGSPPPSGGRIYHSAAVRLNKKALALLEKEIAEVKGDPDRAKKVEYITLLVDGEEGFAATLSLGWKDGVFSSPNWATREKAELVVKALTAPRSEFEELRLHAETIHIFQGHHGQGVKSLSTSFNGELLASASQLEAFVRKTSNGEIVTEIDRAKGNVVFDSTGKILAAVNLSGVSLYDVATGKKLQTFKSENHPYQDCYGVALSPNGQRLALGSERGLKVWDLVSNTELHSISAHLWDGNMTDVAFSPDGTKIASANWGGHIQNNGETVKAPNEVKVWDAETGKPVATLSGGGHGVAFSPDGNSIASGNYFDGTASVWEIESEKELVRLSGHKHGVTEVAFSPDGKWLATAGRDNLVKIWDSNTGREVASLSGHTNVVTSVAFSPDGKRLYSASEDRSIRVWEFAPVDADHEKPQRKANDEGTELSNQPIIHLYFQEWEFIEGVTSHKSTVLGDGPLKVFTHLEPALKLSPEHVKTMQLHYYDELATVKLELTREATKQMASCLEGQKDRRRLVTALINRKENGNQAFTIDPKQVTFRMEFFSHDLEAAQAIVDAYAKKGKRAWTNPRKVSPSKPNELEK